MTLTDMRCDRCGSPLSGPAWSEAADPSAGVRFSYHPGDPRMRDDAGVLCGRCWSAWTSGWGDPRARECARCGVEVSRRRSLHLRRADAPGNGWQLCARHAAEVLNELRTVTQKFDPESFRLPLDDGSGDGSDDETDEASDE